MPARSLFWCGLLKARRAGEVMRNEIWTRGRPAAIAEHSGLGMFARLTLDRRDLPCIMICSCISKHEGLLSNDCRRRRSMPTTLLEAVARQEEVIEDIDSAHV
jgi:hypothetical protein